MKFNITNQTFLSLLFLMVFSSTALQAQPCTETDVQCGVVEFTEFSLISTGHTGAGTAADPYIADQMEFKLCADVQQFGETGLNYLHGVFVRNVPNNATISNTTAVPTHSASGEQTINTPGIGTSDATQWLYFDTDDGLSVADYPTNVAAADGDGFIPFKGFYTVQDSDTNPRDNFGDPGEGTNLGVGASFESYVLDDFCFYITINPPTDGSSNSWNPNLGISGDGSTGSHSVAALDCFITGFFPSCGGNDANDGNVFYGAATNTGGGGSGGVTCTSNDAQCGSVEFSEFMQISSGTNGAGTAADPLVANTIEFKFCADVTQYGETGLNYLHGVFVRNLPDGSSISNTSAIAGQTPKGEQAINAPLAGTSDATQWLYFAEDDGLAVADYPTNVATVDGDGFIPYHGFYTVQDADTNPRDNFGDPGEGTNISGATFESYVLDPFCFYITLVPPIDETPQSWKPELGVSGDGSTGSHLAADLSCFIAGFFPNCGGSDGSGNVHYKSTGASDPPLALDLTAFSGTATGDVNEISWTTASDQDVATYVLEKSTTGRIFQAFASTPALQKSTAQQYETADRSPALLTYYRLKAINTDGSIDYSKVIQVQRNSIVDQFTVYPTIFNNEVAIQANATLVKSATVTVTDLNGKVVYQSVEQFTAGQRYTTDLNNLTTGVYVLTIDTANERFHQKLIKQ